jgi:DNA-binding MarR family transcriptional regulator
MVQRARFDKTDGGFVAAEVRQAQPSNDKGSAQFHNNHKKNKPNQAFGEPKSKHVEIVDKFDDGLIREKDEIPPFVREAQEKAKEATREPQEGQAEPPAGNEVDKKEDPKESKPKSKAGRKARVSSEEVHVEYSMQDKKNLLHEARVLEMTYKSINKSLLFEMLLKFYLEGKEIHEDTAPKILSHLWYNARVLDGQKVYLDTIQETAKAVGVSYPSTQKIIKNLIDKGLLNKERNGLQFDSFLVDFLESLTVNKQVVLTFEELEEEQLESITKDSKVNEEMTD